MDRGLEALQLTSCKGHGYVSLIDFQPESALDEI
jgi:hypothetical protein